MLGGVLLLVIAVLIATPSQAADTDKSKTITIVTSTGVGGSLDIIARLISRHMAKYVPGTSNVIVQNMPGAGDVLATNYMFNVAPKDGTYIATVNNTIPLHQVMDGQGVRYDVRKFNWLGSTGAENSAIIVWRTAGVKTIDDLRKKEVVLGGTGVGSGTVIYPVAMNNILGTKFKIVFGYKTSEDVNIALERGEVQARSFALRGINGQHPDWVKENKIVFVAQVGARRDKALPDVPLISELAKNEEERKILNLISFPEALGTIYLAPPNMTAETLTPLQTGFQATLRDKDLLAEAAKLRLNINPMSAEELGQIIDETVNVSPEVAAKAKEAMEPPASHAENGASSP
jgi:tripartite-type tricarboxylate transporter receptor subunit TctC